MMLGVPVLNYIFYSTKKFKNTTMEILEDLGKNLGASQWYQVQSSYMAKNGTAMTPALRFGGSVVVDEGDACWSGRALGDTTAAAVIACLIKVGRLAYSSNSLTLVLTGPDVSQGSRATASFCAGYCGWHSTQVRSFVLQRVKAMRRGKFFFSGSVGVVARKMAFFFQSHRRFFFSSVSSNKRTKQQYDAQGRPFRYGFIGSPVRCPTGCAPQSAASPNANFEADGMVREIFYSCSFFSLRQREKEKLTSSPTRKKKKKNKKKKKKTLGLHHRPRDHRGRNRPWPLCLVRQLR